MPTPTRKRTKAVARVATPPRCPHCAAMEAEAVALHDANEWLREVAVDALVRADQAHRPKPAEKRWGVERDMLLGQIKRLQDELFAERSKDNG